MLLTSLILKTALVLAALPTSGFLYQYASSRYENYAYTSIGKMVDIGGYKLHIQDTGTGTGGPTVILDAGMGSNSLDWCLVQSEIAHFTRVCSYDRAGTGWSEESPHSRTSEVVIHELHTLLKNAGVPGPYILVGHSFGGVNARLYAQYYPDEVAGIILVDAAHEHQMARLPKATEQLQVIVKRQNILLMLSRLGIVRLLHNMPAAKKQLEKLPGHIRPFYLSQKLQTKHTKTMLAEAIALEESLKQLAHTKETLRDKPLIVITAGKAPSALETGISPEENNEWFTAWHELQKDLLTKSARSKQIIAEKSGHMIPLEQPEVIVKAICDMIIDLGKQ